MTNSASITQPQNAQESEQKLLGNLLTGKVLYVELESIVKPEDLYDPTHRRVFEAVHNRYSGKEEFVDASVIQSFVPDIQISDYKYYADGNPLTQARLIAEKSALRFVNGKLHDLTVESGQPFTTPDALLHKIGWLKDQLEKEGLRSDYEGRDALSVLERKDKKYEQLYLNCPALDMGLFAHAGMRKGHNTTIYASSGHGKTEFAKTCVSDLLQQGYKGVWFQMEDTDKVTAKWMYESGVTRDQLQNLYVIDDYIYVDQIEAMINKLKVDKDIDFFVVDYIQKVKCNLWDLQKDTEQASSRLTDLARVKNLCYICCSQVTLNGERKGYERFPEATDWRYSQQIEQDAHLIVSIFRPWKVNTLRNESTGNVKSPKGKWVGANQVYARQAKVRGGAPYEKTISITHKENGYRINGEL